MLSGSHRAVGVFGAKGPGIRHGWNAGELSLLDIAPTVLHSLGVAVPEELQGRVPEEIYDEDFHRQRPVRKRAARAAAAQKESAAAVVTATPEDEQAVLEHLRDLGYIE